MRSNSSSAFQPYPSGCAAAVLSPQTWKRQKGEPTLGEAKLARTRRRRVRSVQGDQLFAEGVEHSLIARVEAQLVQDVPDVVLDRVLRDE